VCVCVCVVCCVCASHDDQREGVIKRETYSSINSSRMPISVGISPVRELSNNHLFSWCQCGECCVCVCACVCVCVDQR